jgi:hypothetical protein
MNLTGPPVPAPYCDTIDGIAIFYDEGRIYIILKSGEEENHTRESLEVAYPGLWKRMTQ